MNRRLAADLGFFAAVAGVVYALKLHHSSATAADLRWILAPTAAAVEALTGKRFIYEDGAGYLSTELSFLIAPSCAGVNFLIAAFLTGCVGFYRAFPAVRQRVRLFAASLGGAYVAAVLANVLRIVLAVRFRDAAGDDAAHRLLGVCVYAVTLTGMFLVTQRLVLRGPRAA